MIRPPSDSIASICSSYAAMILSIVTSGPGARWSVPAPQAISASSRPAASLSDRAISSCASGQPRPMPRCAVSIASATPRPRSQRRWRNRERRVPVDRGREPRIVRRQRIGDDMRRGIGDARKIGSRVLFERDRRAAQPIGGDRPVGIGEIELAFAAHPLLSPSKAGIHFSPGGLTNGPLPSQG